MRLLPLAVCSLFAVPVCSVTLSGTDDSVGQLDLVNRRVGGAVTFENHCSFKISILMSGFTGYTQVENWLEPTKSHVLNETASRYKTVIAVGFGFTVAEEVTKAVVKKGAMTAVGFATAPAMIAAGTALSATVGATVAGAAAVTALGVVTVACPLCGAAIAGSTGLAGAALVGYHIVKYTTSTVLDSAWQLALDIKAELQKPRPEFGDKPMISMMEMWEMFIGLEGGGAMAVAVEDMVNYYSSTIGSTYAQGTCAGCEKIWIFESVALDLAFTLHSKFEMTITIFPMTADATYHVYGGLPEPTPIDSAMAAKLKLPSGFNSTGQFIVSNFNKLYIMTDNAEEGVKHAVCATAPPMDKSMESCNAVCVNKTKVWNNWNSTLVEHCSSTCEQHVGTNFKSGVCKGLRKKWRPVQGATIATSEEVWHCCTFGSKFKDRAVLKEAGVMPLFDPEVFLDLPAFCETTDDCVGGPMAEGNWRCSTTPQGPDRKPTEDVMEACWDAEDLKDGNTLQSKYDAQLAQEAEDYANAPWYKK